MSRDTVLGREVKGRPNIEGNLFIKTWSKKYMKEYMQILRKDHKNILHRGQCPKAEEQGGGKQVQWSEWAWVVGGDGGRR